MKRTVLFFLFAFQVCFFNNSALYSQQTGNEWIQYSQKYFRFSIASDGVYRLPYSLLQEKYASVGVDIASLNVGGFQIYGRGAEIPVYIHLGHDLVFNGEDYIEFYAQRNDGWLDEGLYAQGKHTNPYYSLFNDTASYFLTWTPALNGLRFAEENSTDFSMYTALPYFKVKNVVYYNAAYSLGRLYEQNTSSAVYEECEGWLSSSFGKGGSMNVALQTPNRYTGGPNAEIEVAVAGLSSPWHHLQITLPGIVIDTTYIGYKYSRFKRTIPAASLGTNTTTIKFASINDLNTPSDYHAVAFAKVTYPHTSTLESGVTNYHFFVENWGSLPKNVLSFTSSSIANTAGDTARLYDLTSRKRIRLVKEGNTFKGFVQNSLIEKELYVTSDKQIQKITTLIPVNGNGQFIDFTNSEYINSDYIIITHKKLWTAAQDYKNYRKLSGYPNLYNPVVVDIDELYDQFAYGIPKNPVAIRNFIRFAVNTFAEVPKHVLLLGKSLRSAETNMNTYPSWRKNATWYAQTLVPTIGTPPSDVLLTNITANSIRQAIPIGRISANSPEQVTIYLQKVREYENSLRSPQPWMKHILHFGGGSDATQQNRIKSYLNNFKAIAQDTLFGAIVTSYFKTSTDPIQINHSDSLKSRINEGVSVMTFFGHASGVGVDMSIDNPEEYNNYQKYPFIISNSCFTGDIFRPGEGVNQSPGERFIFLPDKGGIAFLSPVSTGLDLPLHTYSRTLYKQFCQLNYGKPIGKCIQEVINEQSTGDQLIRNLCLDMALAGDPAIVVNYFGKPDYAVESSGIALNPAPVSTEMNSAEVNIQYFNLGRAIHDTSFVVEVRRVFPDNTDTLYTFYKPAPYHSDSISFTLPIDRIKSPGVNKLIVTVDASNRFEEISKTNNTATLTFNVESSDVFPVYPWKYAIVPDARQTLYASTGDPFASARTYKFEMDTTDRFNSPFKQTTTVEAPGGVVAWTLPFLLQDKRVYYWRVANNADTNWRESSFEYYDTKTGSGQSHFYQFKDNAYQYSQFLREERKFGFIQNIKSIVAQTGYTWYIPETEVYTKVNGAVITGMGCAVNCGGIQIMVIDTVSGECRMNNDLYGQPTTYGQISCKDYPTPYFNFCTNTAQGMQNAINFLNTVSMGNYVLISNTNEMRAPTFPEELYQLIESFGSSRIREVGSGQPYLFFGIKGADPSDSRIIEVIGSNSQEIINLNTEIRTNWDSGTMQSEFFGPSPHYHSLHWDILNIPDAEGDDVKVSLYGIDNQGARQRFIHNAGLTEKDIYGLETLIPANYPRVQLKAGLKDSIHNTSPQFAYWRLYHDDIPETAISPSIHYSFYNQTIEEGDSIRFSVATKNISQTGMDSLLVVYRILKDNTPVIERYKRLREHPAGDILIDSVTFASLGLSGTYILQVEFNPDNDQLELNHSNNIGEIMFNVNRDKINPVLDVTFDGNHIFEGELISSKPNISITLKDENKFLLLNDIRDTVNFRVLLLAPKSTEYRRIPFYANGEEVMEFIPSNGAQNKCNIRYTPSLLQDGTYKLRVEAKDKSDNLSGENYYAVSFEVINKSTITEIVNYPNPFSTSTRFVFTLTGSELPTFFMIQIMTISGRVVREIGLDEIGSIKIGRNITDFAWDGRDQYGDLLANGIYMYRVITQIDGENIERNSTSAKKYFTKEFGKMCIIR